MNPAEQALRELKFRDPEQGRALAATLARVVAGRERAPMSVMHVCGSHEQAIANFGLRATFPSLRW
jgi:hydrogenase expression/formation protein HypD